MGKITIKFCGEELTYDYADTDKKSMYKELLEHYSELFIEAKGQERVSCLNVLAGLINEKTDIDDNNGFLNSLGQKHFAEIESFARDTYLKLHTMLYPDYKYYVYEQVDSKFFDYDTAVKNCIMDIVCDKAFEISENSLGYGVFIRERDEEGEPKKVFVDKNLIQEMLFGNVFPDKDHCGYNFGDFDIKDCLDKAILDSTRDNKLL